MITDVFCKIIKGELPSQKVWEDGDILVIKDINPQAPVHLLIMPKEHFEKLDDLKDGQASLLGRLLMTADRIAHESGLEKGYRLIINEGDHGGKLVPHLHVHLLGGKKLGPKMVRE